MRGKKPVILVDKESLSEVHLYYITQSLEGRMARFSFWKSKPYTKSPTLKGAYVKERQMTSLKMWLIKG